MTVDIYQPHPLDGIEAEELQLYNLINDYRVSNNLAPIPLSASLSLVANRHVVDLQENVGTLTHDWSDATGPEAYWYAPQRLNTAYPGLGYENAYWSSNGATAEGALVGWQNSSGHNAVILNQGMWADNDWSALGIGIYQDYAVMWVGEEVDPAGSPLTGGSAPSNTTDPVTGMDTEIYRCFNTQLGYHLYSASTVERDDLIANHPAFSYEGVAYKASATAQAGMEEVYRFFNTAIGNHMFTTSEVERDHLIQNVPDFNYEGIAYYVMGADANQGTDIYRFFNTQTGVHLYTASAVERDHIIATDPVWNYEGVAFEAAV
jgi:hypothetical protein